MKKRISACLAVIFALLMTVNVWADAGQGQSTDYNTDYYMIVESRDGGVDIFSEASENSTKLNDVLIPNGSALHIRGEKQTDDKKEWGLTEYHGMNGFVLLDDLKPATLQEAIDSELGLGKSAYVDYDAQVNANGGSITLYRGPGEKFGAVSGAAEIPNGTTIHITREAGMNDGSHWGQTSASVGEGWINLDGAGITPQDPSVAAVTAPVSVKMAEFEADDAQGAEGSDTAENTVEGVVSETEGAAEDAEAVGKVKAEETTKPTNIPTQKPTSTPTPKPTKTPTPKPTATNTPTPEPTATNTPTPEPTATNTPTPEPTDTPTPEATSTSTPEPTEEVTETPEPTEEADKAPSSAEEKSEADAEDAQETSAKEVKSSSSPFSSPILWVIVAVIVILLVFLFFLKKK